MTKVYIDKVALLYLKDEKLLMARSKGKDRFYNPGGKRDLGESDAATLIREVQEELDVDIDPRSIQYYGTFEAQAHGKSEGVFVRTKCYTATFHGEPKASGEIEEIRFLSYAEKDLSTFVDFLIFDDLKAKNLIA